MYKWVVVRLQLSWGVASSRTADGASRKHREKGSIVGFLLQGSFKRVLRASSPLVNSQFT